MTNEKKRNKTARLALSMGLTAAALCIYMAGPAAVASASDDGSTVTSGSSGSESGSGSDTGSGGCHCQVDGQCYTQGACIPSSTCKQKDSNSPYNQCTEGSGWTWKWVCSSCKN